MTDESLCRACALCCDGTLFSVVRVSPTEAATARRHGLPVVGAHGGGEAMPQRCAALDDRDCRIYGERPSQCAGYECLLLQALRAGEVSSGEALEIVAEARALVRAKDARAHDFVGRRFLGRSARR